MNFPTGNMKTNLTRVSKLGARKSATGKGQQRG